MSIKDDISKCGINDTSEGMVCVRVQLHTVLYVRQEWRRTGELHQFFSRQRLRTDYGPISPHCMYCMSRNYSRVFDFQTVPNCSFRCLAKRPQTVCRASDWCPHFSFLAISHDTQQLLHKLLKPHHTLEIKQQTSLSSVSVNLFHLSYCILPSPNTQAHRSISTSIHPKQSLLAEAKDFQNGDTRLTTSLTTFSKKTTQQLPILSTTTTQKHETLQFRGTCIGPFFGPQWSLANTKIIRDKNTCMEQSRQ